MKISPEAAARLHELRVAHGEFKAAELRRREAIQEASSAGCALREISDALDRDLSPEVVHGIVGPRSGVAFVWKGAVYQISEPQTRALIYKADGFGRNAFPGDVELIGAGTGWLSAAGDLGIAMRRVHTGIATEPLELDEEHAFALYQILRLTFMTGMTLISDLRTALHVHFDSPALTRRGRR